MDDAFKVRFEMTSGNEASKRQSGDQSTENIWIPTQITLGRRTELTRKPEKLQEDEGLDVVEEDLGEILPEGETGDHPVPHGKMKSQKKSWWTKKRKSSTSNFVFKCIRSAMDVIEVTSCPFPRTEEELEAVKEEHYEAMKPAPQRQAPQIPKTTQMCRGMANFVPYSSDEISLVHGEVIKIVPQSLSSNGWIFGENEKGDRGWLPSSYVIEEANIVPLSAITALTVNDEYAEYERQNTTI